nr:EOG090X08VB [Lepidurus arcticus]
MEINPPPQHPVAALDLADPPPIIRPRIPTNTATVRPTSSFPQQQQRTSSLPQLEDVHVKEKEEPPPLRARKPQSQLKERRAGVQSMYGDFAPLEIGPPQPPIYHPPPPPQLLGPPKPPRTNSGTGNLITNGALIMKAQKHSQDSKAPEGEIAQPKPDVRTALQQWQMAHMTGNMERSKSATVVGGLQSKDDHANADMAKKSNKRREPRRHTLQNGIDYNMLKRMQAMEQEKEVLGNGLQAVERTRDWFHKQLGSLHEQMRSLGKGLTDASLEAHLERLQFKIARVQDVSRQLTFLVENSDRGFPLHMNLAMRQPRLGYGHIERENNAAKQGDEEINRIIRRLKDQNHQLTEVIYTKIQ